MSECGLSDCKRSTSGDALVCDACAVRGRRSVELLRVRYVELSRALVPGQSAQGDKIASPAKGSRAPLSAAALDAQQSIAALLYGAQTSVRASLGLSESKRDGSRESVVVDRSATLLLAQWERIAELPLVVPLVERLLRTRAHVDRVLGLDRLVHRLPAPCPTCDLLTLGRHDGDSYVRCLHCGSSWTEAEYRHLVRVLVDEQQQRRGA